MEYQSFRRDYKEGEGMMIRGKYGSVQIRIVEISNLEKGRGANLEIFRNPEDLPQEYEIKDCAEHELDYRVFVRINPENQGRGKTVRLECRIPADYNLKVIPRKMLRNHE